MKTVWKFPFDLQDKAIKMVMPQGAKIVLVECDHKGNQPCFWAEVVPDAPQELRLFFVHGTGHPIPEGRIHCGSFQMGAFVWHLYEEVLR